LKAVADRIQAAVRRGDSVARLGGDEFIVVLPDLDNEQGVVPVAREAARLHRAGRSTSTAMSSR
jgi:diguanylate cyclase (GGDEF)-like protein